MIKTPVDFSKAVYGGKWNPDMVVRLYRDLNPLVSRADALKEFKKLKLKVSDPIVRDTDLDYYPTDLSDCVDIDGKWDWDKVMYVYSGYGTFTLEQVKKHMRKVGFTAARPVLNAVALPAKLFHPKALGIVYVPWHPYPSTPPPPQTTLLRPVPWFTRLVEIYGYEEAYLRVAFNMREFYDKK